MSSIRPTASATIEALGPRDQPSREHLVKVTIRLNQLEPRFSDPAHVTTVARKSLEGFAPPEGQADRREVTDLSVRSKGKAGAVVNTVVGVEGTVVWAGRPDDAAIDAMRATLVGEGYRVDIRERRECSESGCAAEAMVDWVRRGDVPSGWYAATVCGKHNYRTCAKCASTYLLTSINTAGQAPSLSCEVCGEVLVEWGGSKTWEAQLIARG